MLSRFPFLLSIFSVNFLFSQDLFVANDSYIYAKDVVLTVTKDIRLDTPTSNIFLRGDAQLFQIDDIKNSDEGEISIYQEQTTGVFEYNYWCSPVGVSIDDLVKENVDFNGSNIHLPDDHTDLTNVVSDPYGFTSNYNSTNTELSSYWIYTLISAGGYNGWNQIFETGNLSPGYGFTLKGSPNTDIDGFNTLDFRGRPNNGTITIDCSFDGTDSDPNSGYDHQVETLTGNPYPSALDLKEFIRANTSVADDGTGDPTISYINGEIYFWEQAVTNSHYLDAYEGGYGFYIGGDLTDDNDNGSYTRAPFQFYNNNGGGIGGSSNQGIDYATLSDVERRFAAVGQGFVITSKYEGDNTPGGGTITFNNDMRVYLPENITDGSIFGKQSNTKKSTEENKKLIPQSHNGINYTAVIEHPTIIPEIRIHTHLNNTFYRESVIAFREGTPNNNTYNRFFDGKIYKSDLNTDAYLLSEGNELAIKSIKYSNDVRIPFGIKTAESNSSVSIKVFHLNHVPDAVNIYVFDKENNTYTDVKNDAFEINLNAGVYNNRFEITFSKSNSLSIDYSIFDGLEVFQNNTISELKIHNPKLLNIKTFSLFDVNGKQVLYDHNMSVNKQFLYSTKSLSDGVYICKITADTNQVFTKKIIIGSNN